MRRCIACRAPIMGAVWECAACHWRAETRDGVAILLPGAHDIAESFSAEQFANLLAVEPRHFWFAARNKLLAWAIDRYFPDATSLLEVGCGTGQVLRTLAHAAPRLRLTAAEGSFAGLREVVRLQPSIDAAQVDATSLPYDDEFDIAGAFDVLEHIPDDTAAMAAIARAVRPGGGVLITVPQHPWLWSAVDDHAGHQRRYTRSQLATLARRAGLEPLLVTSFVSLLLPALFLSRARDRDIAADPMQEFRISPAANRIAGLLMAVERRLIAAGLRLPAGGSLLLVARR